MSRLPTVGGDTGNWGTVLNDFLSQAHNSDGKTKNLYYNVKEYGATGDGSTDDTTSIAAAITAAAAGGIVFFPAGTYILTDELTLSSANIILSGSGASSIIQCKSTFAKAEIVKITADNCGVQNLKIYGGTTTSANNPACNGILISGARYVRIRDLWAYYINGYAIKSAGTTGQSNYGGVMDAIQIYHCAQGIHLFATSAQTFGCQNFLSNINAELIDNGDGIKIEDAQDVWISNFNGAAAGNTTTGSMLHILGASSSVYIVNIDIGVYPGPATTPTVLIETGTNGTPAQIGIVNGIIQAGTIGVSITAGSIINISRVKLFANSTHGISITGGTLVQISDCFFQSNGKTAGSGRYDLNVNISSGTILVKNCIFDSTIGSLTGQVNNSVNDTNHSSLIENCDFYTANQSNAFSGFPYIVRNCINYNPKGKITAPTIGASPTTPSGQQYDCTIYINGGTVSDISIGGNSTGMTSGMFFLPARQSITMTYTVAPTWIWFAN